MKKSLKLITILGAFSLLLTSCNAASSSSASSNQSSASSSSSTSFDSTSNASSSSSSSSSSKEPEPVTYHIVWKNYDGTILQDDESVLKGSTPSYRGAEPQREADAQFSYIWTGWTPEVTVANADAVYTATYKEETKIYVVTWKNYDGRVLKTERLPYGATPEFNGQEPTRNRTAEHEFTFDGWSPEVSEVTDNITYTASYKAEKRKYTITWLNNDGAVLKTEEVPYGTIPSYGDEEPVKESTSQYAYIFAGWSPNVVPVSCDTQYAATYTRQIRTYDITWANYDGTILEVDKDVPYGTVPTFDGETPTRPDERAAEYTFTGWSPKVTYADSDITYYAEYDVKGFFSFEKVEYDMVGQYKLSDINGAPWINSNIYGEVHKIKKPSLKDDFYTAVNYDDIKFGGKSAFDKCEELVDDAFNAAFDGSANNNTTNGAAFETAFRTSFNGSANEVSNYLTSIDVDTYLSTREAFASASGLLNLLPTESGYEVQYNDGYMNDNYNTLPFMWAYYNFYTTAEAIVKVLSNSLKLHYSDDDIDDIHSQEKNLTETAYSDYSYGATGDYSYTVGSLPWGKMKSALMDLGLAANTKITVKKYYTNALNTIYNSLLESNPTLLKKMIVTRLGFDYRHTLGLNIYRQINQLISELGGDMFDDERGLYALTSDNALARKITRICFPILAEQTYIELQSSPEIKAEVSSLIDDVLAGYKNIANKSWLDSETKTKMIKKLDYMKYIACYHDAYKTFGKLGDNTISSKNAFEVYKLYNNMEVDEVVRKNIDDTGFFSFGMHSYTVNAFYAPTVNSFVILNGVARGLLGDCIEEKLSLLGTVVGHEVSHAFDSYGAKYDENGNLNNWWSDTSKKAFNQKVNKVISFFNSISLTKTLKANGSNLNGEATADMGGMKIALMLAKKVDNFDYDKFFRAYANLWLRTPIKLQEVEEAAEDEHPFGYLRTNVTLSQFDEFAQTYDIKPGDGMYVPESQRIKIW